MLLTLGISVEELKVVHGEGYRNTALNEDGEDTITKTLKFLFFHPLSSLLAATTPNNCYPWIVVVHTTHLPTFPSLIAG